MASPQATAPASSSAHASSASSSPASSSPASSATTAQPELCVSVARAQASIARGHKAAFVVTVSTQNGSAADVSVALTSAPSSQQPAFTSGCAKTANAATCTVSAVSDTKPVSLDAQIPVAADASSVSSVTLTATASIVSTVKGTPPVAQETVTVTSAPASPAPSSAPAALGTTVPLGAIPNLNGVSSSLIGAGNAAGLFPAISPAPTARPKPSPAVSAQGTRRNTESVAYTTTLAPVLTAQVAGLIALALAVMLTVTRLSLRRKFRSPKPGS